MILFRYLLREVMYTLLAVTVTLLVIVMSGRFVKYLAQAAAGDLAPEVLFSIILYRLPSFLELVLPLGFFIGILLAYGRLYVESEMTVMSACGIGNSRLAFYTLAPALLIAVLVGWLSMIVSPMGIAKVDAIFLDARNSQGLDALVAGRFRVDEKTGSVSYVEQLDSDSGVFNEVFSAEPLHQKSRGNRDEGADSPDNGELSVLFARQGTVRVDDATQQRWMELQDGNRYVGKPGERSFKVTAFERFHQHLETTVMQFKHQRADARTTAELLASDSLQDKATLQWRISLALLVPVVALIALALSRTNHRRGRYAKMLPAFIIYILYVVALNAARDAIEKQKLPLTLGMWWIHLVFLLLALVLLYGEQGLQRIRTHWRNVRAGTGGSLDGAAA